MRQDLFDDSNWRWVGILLKLVAVIFAWKLCTCVMKFAPLSWKLKTRKMKNPNELPDLKKKYMKNILKITHFVDCWHLLLNISDTMEWRFGIEMQWHCWSQDRIPVLGVSLQRMASVASQAGQRRRPIGCNFPARDIRSSTQSRSCIMKKFSFYCQFCFQDYSFFIERLN